MAFDSARSEIRFGFGLSPDRKPPQSVAAMLEGVRGTDEIATRFPIPTMAEYSPWISRMHAAYRAVRDAPDYNARQAQFKKRRALQRQLRDASGAWMAQDVLRKVHTPDAFRERLVSFWADHFTAVGKNLAYRASVLPYIEEAIRPYLSGSFAALLRSVATSPLMLHSLDQNRSMGSESDVAQRRGRASGLNENFARELLELHTLGVDGPYTQTDVRELARLLTGLSFTREGAFVFRNGYVEPGAETVLGRQYTGREMRPIRMVLEDFAAHPATADHLARKLAVHFVADDPDPALVAHIAARWRETEGDLMAVYGALLDHPAAWAGPARNVKPPLDFVVSACRALAIPPAALTDASPSLLKAAFLGPLALMGQPWMRPVGPDGWPEEDAAWITPQGLAARLRWALAVPERLVRPLPDPRVFVDIALGPEVPEAVRFAANAAESRADAIGLILTSPAFQRR